MSVWKEFGRFLESSTPLIEEATKKSAELDAKHEALVKAIEAKRKELAEKKK